MKGLFRQLKVDFAERTGSAGLDPLLMAARILLWIMLAGVIFAGIMSVIGLLTYLAAYAGSLRVPLWEPEWQPINRLLFGIGALWIIQAIIGKVLAMIAAVECGGVFSSANVARMEGIAWGVVELQILGFVASLAGAPIRGNVNGLELGFDLSPGGVAFALLLFILARVFGQGARMAADLDGTV